MSRGHSRAPTIAAENERTLAPIRERLEPGARGKEWERGRKLAVEDAISLALDALAALTGSTAGPTVPL
jgi:hypothetical protein